MEHLDLFTCSNIVFEQVGKSRLTHEKLIKCNFMKPGSIESLFSYCLDFSQNPSKTKKSAPGNPWTRFACLLDPPHPPGALHVKLMFPIWFTSRLPSLNPSPLFSKCLNLQIRSLSFRRHFFVVSISEYPFSGIGFILMVSGSHLGSMFAHFLLTFASRSRTLFLHIFFKKSIGSMEPYIFKIHCFNMLLQ